MQIKGWRVRVQAGMQIMCGSQLSNFGIGMLTITYFISANHYFQKDLTSVPLSHLVCAADVLNVCFLTNMRFNSRKALSIINRNYVRNLRNR